MGYKVAKPDGAFYLFIEAPDGNSEEFSEKAKAHDVLVVPGTGFGTNTLSLIHIYNISKRGH